MWVVVREYEFVAIAAVSHFLGIYTYKCLLNAHMLWRFSDKTLRTCAVGGWSYVHVIKAFDIYK